MMSLFYPCTVVDRLQRASISRNCVTLMTSGALCFVVGDLTPLQPQDPDLHLVFLHGSQGLEYSSLCEQMIRKPRDKETESSLSSIGKAARGVLSERRPTNYGVSEAECSR